MLPSFKVFGGHGGVLYVEKGSVWMIRVLRSAGRYRLDKTVEEATTIGEIVDIAF